MNVKASKYAREQGLKKIDVLQFTETEDYISAVVYEKRKKNGELMDWLDPVLVFKKEVRHADYDRAKRLAEAAGTFKILPDLKNFKTNYQEIVFETDTGEYGTILKFWGYNSNYLPRRKRWRDHDFKENAKIWMDSTKETSEIISKMLDISMSNISEEDKLESAKEWLNSRGYSA